ncbi:trypsin-like peptidase domain-containing protein [Candidatus Dependentiae bacterium]
MNGEFDKNGVWLKIEKMAQNAVVQVFSQVGKINWKEPYKIGDQFENRGTGFIVNEYGYIVTNYHVIHEAKVVWIQMPALGRKIIHAYVVGFCPDSDIALLAISKEGFAQIKDKLGKVPFLALGDSDTVRRTDSVMVLGYPLGHHNLKSTIGIVSGTASTGGISLIQITAPINPGNSGGPILSSFGSVIGMAVSGAVMAQNVGYAIPINELKIIFDDLQKQRLLRKPFIGAMFQNSSKAQAKLLGNPTPAGFYIKKIFKDTLMEKAGVQPGDMLYMFNGHGIDAYGEAKVPWTEDRVILRDLISRLSIGDLVSMVIYRKGEKKEINFTLEPPPVYPIRMIFPGYDEIDYEVIGGMVIMELRDNLLPFLSSLNPDIIKYAKIENKTESVLVITHILPGSYAQQIRCINPGEIIKKVNGVEIKTLNDFREFLRKSLDTDFLSIETAEKTLAVFEFRAMLKDELNMAVSFAYPISVSTAKLINEIEGKEK